MRVWNLAVEQCQKIIVLPEHCSKLACLGREASSAIIVFSNGKKLYFWCSIQKKTIAELSLDEIIIDAFWIDYPSRICIATALNVNIYNFCLLYTSDAADEEDSVDLSGICTIKQKKQ
eukprot:TRINITY_DN7431_c0_g1_i1.p6 TRINITY_DN7431_c0_g1~~TRINITY_DN7431_c0_g1_i1.p6  ORF type:complete len:118 (+),score=13.26 TRINITY_DN7431_c0_g1_i1:1547-1900(+)